MTQSIKDTLLIIGWVLILGVTQNGEADEEIALAEHVEWHQKHVFEREYLRVAAR